jgi:hypothetical protein
MITFGHIIDFILQNRGSEAYKGMSKDQIEKDIWVAWHDNCFLYETDDKENIIGWIQYEINHSEKVLFVYQNIALSLCRLKHFLDEFFKRYPTYELRAMRHGKYVTYNATKLLTKLNYYGRRLTIK